MLSAITIVVQYGAERKEISVATKLAVMNGYLPHADGDQRVANLKQLQTLIDDYTGTINIDFTCPHGEHLIEDVLRTLCRTNNILIPPVLNIATANRTIKIAGPQPQANSWFPGFSNFTMAAAGVAVLGVLVEATKSYWEAPRPPH